MPQNALNLSEKCDKNDQIYIKTQNIYTMGRFSQKPVNKIISNSFRKFS
jgi:hypothetical protein